MNSPTTRMPRRAVRLVLAAALVAGVAACSSDDDAQDDAEETVADTAAESGDESDAGGGGEPGDAVIAGFAFDPDPIEVPSGTTITWTNNDSASHTVTGAGELEFDSGSIGTGETFTLTVDAAGEYAYVCTIHGQMAGTIVVS